MVTYIIYVECPDNKIIVADNFKTKKSMSAFNSNIQMLSGETVTSDDNQTYIIVDISTIKTGKIISSSGQQDTCVSITLKKFNRKK